MIKVLHLSGLEENVVVSALRQYRHSHQNQESKVKCVDYLLSLLQYPSFHVLTLDEQDVCEQLGYDVEISEEVLEELAFRVQEDIVQIGDFERLVKKNYLSMVEDENIPT